MKLTENEQLKVTENHNLIYQYMLDNDLDIEEWYGVFAIELCKAIKHYDESKGNLSTLFYTMCDNARWNLYRRDTRLKRDSGFMYSLDYEYESEFGTETFGNLIECNETDVLEDVLCELKIDELKNSEHKDVIVLKTMGYTQEEIGSQLGVAQSTISKILTSVRKEYFNDC